MNTIALNQAKTSLQLPNGDCIVLLPIAALDKAARSYNLYRCDRDGTIVWTVKYPPAFPSSHFVDVWWENPDDLRALTTLGIEYRLDPDSGACVKTAWRR